MERLVGASPSVWTRYLEQLDATLGAVEVDRDLRERYQRAHRGSTGIEPFDAWVRELVETGYLHNHSRMWFASVWVFTLELPWELGADFFLRHLLDGDPASNTLSWRWVAGLHTAGKTYLTTPGNLEKYAGRRFFADGPPEGLSKLATRASALSENDMSPSMPLNLPAPANARPRSGLLLTEEDLVLDAPLTPRAVALWMPNEMFPLSASELVRAFKAEAGADAIARAKRKWPQASTQSELSSSAQIVRWVQQQGLEEVHVAYVPQGHLRSQLEELTRMLARINCEVRFFVRDYDRVAWPNANKGYFQLKKQIPKMLEVLLPDQSSMELI